MAKEAKVWEVIKNAGYEPIENKSIIVSYAPENLSDAIVKDDVITLSVQQKELSALRTSGFLCIIMLGGNWHSRNMDGTLKMLKEIPSKLQENVI